MQIVATRTRAAGAEPLFQYMVLVPFDQLSEERQFRIHYRTDFGGRRNREPHARLAEIIAPIDHLRLPPGLERHRQAREILPVARRVEALAIGAIFPEMTAGLIPTLFRAASEFDDVQVFTRTHDLSGSFPDLARRIDRLTAADLGLAD